MAVLPGSAARSARGWVVRSVVVRARDGPQRLAQVYRLLLTDSTAASPAAATRNDQPSAGAACATRQKEPADGPVPAAP